MAALLTHDPIATTPPGARPQLQLVVDNVGRRAVVPEPHVVRRRQLVALVVVAAFVWLLVAAATTTASYLFDDVPAAAASSGPITHVVQPGDTVWSIARQHYPTGDIRPLVSRMVESSGQVLVPGQVVVVNP
ncbi:MAG: LysM domain-containing protein [Acidimicrobiales bacterium]|nr:LysM peptidoglycan-binding domain-containing protein [Acidimicrobiales bacterium]